MNSESKIPVNASAIIEQIQNLTEKSAITLPQVSTALNLKQDKIIPDPKKSYTDNVAALKENNATKLDNGFNLGDLLNPKSSMNKELKIENLNTKKEDLLGFDLSASTLAKEATITPKTAASDLSALTRQLDNLIPSSNKAEPTLAAMTKPLNHPEWKQEFNERIMWMQNKSIPSAELRLNPANLGPISIRINMDQEQQANIAINVQNAAVREVVEASLPRLREMLNAQQIGLADVNVSQQQQQGQGNARQAMEDVQEKLNKMNANNRRESEEIEESSSPLAEEINLGRTIASKGLLSLYA